MRTRTRLAPMSLWIARVVWASLPITAGFAAADALDAWSTGPGILAASCLWIAWAIGLVALLAPRPLGLTALRAIAPCFFGLAIAVAIGGDSDGSWLAVVAAGLAAVVAMLPSVSTASVNGASYGDELRFPLKIPPALFLGPIELAPPIIVAGLVAGPLLLADGRVALGLPALIGIAIAALAARSLHTLAKRFVVLVPAGVAIVDPFTLTDPVLLPRERITSLFRVDPRPRPPAGALDLRVGAVSQSLSVTLDRVTDSLQVRRGRRGAETVTTAEIWFSAVGSRDLLTNAGARKIRTH